MADEIDRVSARLHAQRPSLDTITLALSDRVIRTARHLEAGRRKTLATRELEVWEYDVLLALRAAESTAGLSPGELMVATQVASATVTNRVNRLARRGFVSREPDPADHRGVLVRLTPTGKRRVEQAASDVAVAEREVWAELPERRRSQINVGLCELLSTLE